MANGDRPIFLMGKISKSEFCFVFFVFDLYRKSAVRNLLNIQVPGCAFWFEPLQNVTSCRLSEYQRSKKCCYELLRGPRWGLGSDIIEP